MSRVAKNIFAHAACLVCSAFILAGALYTTTSAFHANTAKSAAPVQFAAATQN